MAWALFTTIDSEDGARSLARGAVDARLAACVQIERIESVYLWDGVQQEPEWRLLFKVSDAAHDALMAHLQAEHPYDEPALWSVRMQAGAPSFLAWIDASCGPARDQA